MYGFCIEHTLIHLVNLLGCQQEIKVPSFHAVIA